SLHGSRPVGVRAHARPQARNLLDGISADGEGSEVKVAGGPGRAPTRILTLRRDELDLGHDLPVAKSGKSNLDAIAELQGLDEVLAQIEPQPNVVHIDQGDERDARPDTLALFDIDLIDLSFAWCEHHHLIDQ